VTTEVPVKRKPGRPRKNPLPQVQAVVSEKATVEREELITAPPTTPAPVKVYIHPSFGEKDEGDGGIRRVVEGQLKHLPAFGIDIVQNPGEADVIAYHATVPKNFVNLYPRKAFVAICHGLYWSEYEWDNWSIKANAEVMDAIRVADRVVACSEWVANAIRRHTSRPVDVVFHGIDAEDWTPVPIPESEPPYVLWNKTRPDPVCDPEPVKELARIMPEQAFVSTFGSDSENMLVTGKLEFAKAKELIRRAGVYLCTTRETFGIGTLEAMACGVPVVGFRWGGQAEFIEHGVDGWLVTPGDIDGLKQGVEWALANRTIVGAAARRKAEAFRWDRFAEQYATIFKEAHEAKTAIAPRTSIIVTNYNLHDYLGECLSSVEQQTDNDWECIVVDDASPNESGRIIAQKFCDRDNRFKLIVNEKNQYLAEARNIGIRAACGRYILPLDADDQLAPETLSLLTGALDTDRSIHIAYGNVRFTEEDGKTLSIYGAQYEPGHSSWPYDFVYENQIKQYNLLPYCSMYRKEVWRDTGGYRRRCRTAEDADLWVRASSYGFRPKMVTREDTLVYRNRAASMSRIQGDTNWIRWFSWSKLPAITPAGAVTNTQLPVPSLDPIVISVIIPVGPGHEKLVTDAIDSVDTQSFRMWECVVVNDTGKPLETELPSWVRVVNTSGKLGPARARNEGIRASKGRLFLPLDADDYLEPDALQMMLENSENGKYVVYSDHWLTSNDGKRVELHECDDFDPQLVKGTRRQFKNEIREGMIHSVTALTPKAAWTKIGGYDETLPAWEDWDFQIALCNAGYCSRRVAWPLFMYRMDRGFRREENFAFFDESKKGILRKWGHLWEGGKEMPCGSCGARRAPQTMAMPLMNAVAPSKPQNSDAVLIRYNGTKAGTVSFLGVTKTRYYFAGGEEKYVHAADAETFLRYSEFEAVTREEPAERPPEPVLVADGPPA
jgi:glycosyltransferase involved in cell wall biosynthesis